MQGGADDSTDDSDIENNGRSMKPRGKGADGSEALWRCKRAGAGWRVASALLLLCVLALVWGMQAQQASVQVQQQALIHSVHQLAASAAHAANATLAAARGSTAAVPATVTLAASSSSVTLQYGTPASNCNVRLSDLRVAGATARSSSNTVTSVFDGVYQTGIWTADGGGSGSGSTVEVTARIRSIIRTVVNQYHVRTMLDAPCGAMVWMPLVLEDVEDDLRDVNGKASEPPFSYYGVDAVESILLKAQKTLTPSHPNWSFHALDLAETRFCDEHIDLIFSRDALQHLACPLIIDVLHSFVSSSARLLLVGSYDKQGHNKHIVTGDYFSIDLRKSPYSLQTGLLHVYNEWTSRQVATPDKQALLYDLQALRQQNIDWDNMKKGCGPAPH
jgi:hypothetical protein